MADQQTPRGGVTVRTAIVIGAGFSGLETAKALKNTRIDYLVLEKGGDVGGTWYWNTYPGAACDISSYLYVPEDDQDYDWDHLYAYQPAILNKLRRYAASHGLLDNIVFGTKVVQARWDDNECRWHVYTEGGAEYVCQFLISGAGALHIPSIPEFPGLDEFEGPAFHTAEWDDSVDLTGKKVAVIGTGASAIQIIPEIVDTVGELQVYQRTPPWVMPLGNPAIPKLLRRAVKRSPRLRKLLRSGVFLFQESLGYAVNHEQRAMLKLLEVMGKWNIRRWIRDKELRRKLTPQFEAGCKRLLKHTGYYRALNKPNAQVITDTIVRITSKGIVTRNTETNRETFHKVDVIIFGTGFVVTEAHNHTPITGEKGEGLSDRWNRESMQALRGTTVAGFPNLFFLLGPNTGLGHNSVVLMIEAQIGYVLQAINWVRMSGAQALSPTRKAQDVFNEALQIKLAGTVQNNGGCNSWYLDKHGKNPVLWGGSVKSFQDAVRELDPLEYVLVE